MEAQPVSEKRALLKSVFGYEGFRPGQEQLIDALLQGRDVMGIMPTGAGKSMCYQLPALLLPGITLVVSPLISLMKDQVNALVQSGVRAAYLNSSLTEGQTAKAIANAMEGVYKIIYVAPERLFTPRFQNFAQGMNISMVCVDEAHCVSQWGQDFRPGYLDIARFLETLPRARGGAFTATATGEVREDIVRLLGLADPVTVVTGFDRPNLYFGVEEPRDKYAAVTRYLAAHTGASGIVYCLTRKTVEEVCEKLRADGYAATRYHAGLSADERQRNQDAFLYDEARVMVATNAFGMGIDKSNVSFVLHYNMPKNIESYYQEAGRAGRDGQPADCILLYGGKDVVTNRFFIEKDDENDALDEETRRLVREKDEERLRRMTFYCHSGSCLRAYLLRISARTRPEHCDNCSVCSTQTEKVDVSGEARIIFLVPEGPALPAGRGHCHRRTARQRERARAAPPAGACRRLWPPAQCVRRAAARDLQPPYGRGLSGTGSGAVSHAFTGGARAGISGIRRHRHAARGQGGTPRPREHGGIARGYGAVRAPEGTAFEIRKARGRACVRYFHRRDAARHERPKAAHDG